MSNGFESTNAVTQVEKNPDNIDIVEF